MTVVAIIPARGGSKGIPRKNLRPLSGKPMIYYSIEACLSAPSVEYVVVTTDDDEIALISERLGAKVIIRPANLANDEVTLDEVIVNAVEVVEKELNVKSSLIVTVQPTSPLIKSIDIDNAVAMFAEDKSLDTVLTVVDDRHLCWGEGEDGVVPRYKERVNRQSLEANYRETGAIIACSRTQLNKKTRIGGKVGLFILEKERSFDIDDYSDFYLCESILNRKKLVFTVVGYDQVGLGHAFRVVMLASELIKFDLVFICEERSLLAKRYIESFNYTVYSCPNGTMADSVIEESPDIVVNDILDTEEDYIKKLKNAGIKVVNFEDLGEGYKYADLVVNALYPSPLPYSHVKVGVDYFCLRDEFLILGTAETNKQKKKKIIITFGGVDEGNLTLRVAKVILPWCIENQFELTIVLGPGYSHKDLLMTEYLLSNKSVKIVENTKCISSYMKESTLAVTSGGRTVLELAALDVPTIVICQNEREELHTFASDTNGVTNLGFRENVDDSQILNAFIELLENEVRYKEVKRKLKKFDLSSGKKNVLKLINSLLDE